MGQSLIWARDFQGSGTVGVADVEIGIDHKVYMIGWLEGTCDFDPGPGTLNLTSTGMSDLFFAKYDTSGFPLWVKIVEGPTWESGYDLEVDRNMNVIIAGFYSVSPDFDPGPGVVTLPTDGITNGFVAKYNGGGAFVWANPINGLGWDMPYALKVEADDHVLLAGSFEDTVDFDPGPGVELRESNGVGDMFLVRYDRFGNLDWAYTAGGLGEDLISGIEIDDSGHIVFNGQFMDTVDFDPGAGLDVRSADIIDMFWSVLDTSGAYLSKTMTLGGAGSDATYRTYLDGEGSYIVTGYFEGTIDFDTGPGVSSLTSVGGFPDSFYAKYDSSGVLQYVRQLSTIGLESIAVLEVDQDDNFMLAGYFPYTLDIQPNADTVMLTSAGMRDIFLAKYEVATGNLIWGRRMGGTGQDEAGNIAFDAYGNFYFCGYFNDSVDFDLDAGTSWLVNSNSYDAGFLAKYNNDFLTASEVAETEQGWVFYPNPAHEWVKLVSSDPMRTVTLHDLRGLQVAQYAPGGALQLDLDLSALPAGTYLIQVETPDFTQIQRILLR